MVTPGKPRRSTREPALGGTTTVVETACPLDCPDACSLSVTVRQGKVVTLFKPVVDPSANPPINDTDDTTIGIVRTYQVSAPGRLMGRYEVRIGDSTTGTGVLDVSAQHVGIDLALAGLTIARLAVSVPSGRRPFPDNGREI